MVITSLRKIILFMFVFLPITVGGYGQESPQILFDRANQHLKAGNYREAILLYKNIEARNTVSGALFLNMGITYQRVDSLGKAKYYFLKAAQFDATEREASRALEFVETQFSRQSAVLPKLPWDVVTHWLQQNIGSTGLLALGIILLNIGILIYVAHWFTSWQPKYFAVSGYVVTGLSVLIIASGFYTQYVSDRYSTAVMVTEKAPVYERPEGKASLVSQTYEGYTFTVDHYRSSTRPGWKYIRMSNGVYGWIPGDGVMVL